MTEGDWHAANRQCLGVRYAVTADEHGKTGAAQCDHCAFLLMMNAGAQEIRFMLPDARPNKRWTFIVETVSDALPQEGSLDPGTLFRLAAHSLALLGGEG